MSSGDLPAAQTAVVTTCSRNRFPSARTLMRSVRRVHPDWKPYVLLVDETGDSIDPAREPFEIVTLDRLNLPEHRKFIFRYNIMELNTALKPFVLTWLFEHEGVEQCVFFDSDIYLYEPMAELGAMLADGAMMVLTPHLTRPQHDGKCPGEVEVLMAGAWNLGMLALRRHPHLDAFLQWWRERLEYHCVDDVSNGCFVDQKWMDLAPGLFEGVRVLRHEGYNVAYWNLPHRRVTRDGERFLVNGQPLVFFHFSGLDPENPERFSKHQDRYTLFDLGPERALVEAYCREVLADGAADFADSDYAFGRFTDGTPIPDDLRAAYRQRPELQETGGEDPFAMDTALFNRPWREAGRGAGLVTEFMGMVLENRPHVRRAFGPVVDRDPGGIYRDRFIRWFIQHSAQEYGVPEIFIEPVRSAARQALPRMLRAPLQLGAIAVAGGVRTLMRLAGPNAPSPTDNRRCLVEWTRALGDADGYSGFHPQDEHDRKQGSAWMGPIVQVRIGNPEPGTLRVVGFHPLGLHATGGHTGPMILHLYSGTQQVAVVQLSGRGRFDVSTPIHLEKGTGPVLLTLLPSHFTTPSSVGEGTDPRPLSIRLERLELNDRPILDFSRPDAPHRNTASLTVDRLHVNVIGYHDMRTGIGESARLFSATAEAAGLPYSTCTLGDPDDPASANRVDRPEILGPFNILHVNADCMPAATRLLGADIMRGRTNIGYWHWELESFPGAWRSSLGQLDEVWVPTRFVADAVAAVSPVPVVRIPHAVDFPIPQCADRARFDLPEDAFLFLTIYDMRSGQARKNPEATVRAFRKAFAGNDRVGLVIKVQSGDASPDALARLRQCVSDLPAIRIITDSLPRKEVYALEAACDAFVSLHRSEGFGLCPAECMRLGKPAVATAYSGNTDFMRPGNSCPVAYTLVPITEDTGPYPRGGRWAEPDEDHAAALMKRLVDDDAFRTRIAEAGRRTICTEFSREAVGRLIRARLETLSNLHRT